LIVFPTFEPLGIESGESGKLLGGWDVENTLGK